jgi:hypothetical protein
MRYVQILLSSQAESRYSADHVNYGYCVVYNGLGRYQGYFHGENRAKVHSHSAITQSCHEASDVTLADRYLVS